jgi:hypothetical protein
MRDIVRPDAIGWRNLIKLANDKKLRNKNPGLYFEVNAFLVQYGKHVEVARYILDSQENLIIESREDPYANDTYTYTNKEQSVEWSPTT